MNNLKSPDEIANKIVKDAGISTSSYKTTFMLTEVIQAIEVERARAEAVEAKLSKAIEALRFVAGGCLVPPDGGSPTWDDAIETARLALKDLGVE